MNIVIDGLSGVGKTYFGEKLAQKTGISFLSFLPDLNDVDEYALHQHAVMRQGRYSTPVLLEGSILMSKIMKQWLYKTHKITIKEYIDIIAIDESKVAPFGIIFLNDTYENILAKRIMRGRPFEYMPGLKDLTSVDTYIQREYISFVKAHGINVIVCNIAGKTDDEVLDELEQIIYQLTV